MNIKKYFPLFFLFGIFSILVNAGINNPGGSSSGGGDVFTVSNNVFSVSNTFKANLFASNFVWTSGIMGSVLFVDGAGLITQDNNSLFWDATNKRLGVGTNASILAKVHTVSTNGVDSGVFVDSFSSTASNGASIIGRRAEGTQGSPTAVLSGDLLSSWGGRGYGATGFPSANRSKIHFMASENWSDTVQGSRIEFFTTKIGTTTTTLGATLDDTSSLTVLQSITASNFVQSAGSSGGFVGNGSGLTNLSASALPATSITNITTTAPWLTMSGQGTRVMNIATNGVPVPNINGGSGTNVAFTLGSVLFAATGGPYNQNNSQFFWDNTNFRLGINTNVPASSLHVNGAGKFESSVTVSGATSSIDSGTNAHLNVIANGVSGEIVGCYVTNVTADFASMATLTSTTLAFTVPTTIQTNAVVLVGYAFNQTNNVTITAGVTANGTITTVAHNVSAGTIDPASVQLRLEAHTVPVGNSP